MVNNNGDLISALSANTISTNRPNFYADVLNTATFNDSESINDITGMEMLEVIQKGLYQTLVGRRDDAQAVWEEEDDDASYGEYKALKDTVELLDAFLRGAPKARYSGLRRPGSYDRYDSYRQRY